ncbi:MAG: phosphotransacetylase family protein [Anaerolineae bacterium]|nr:phosphotransacetylase family protein [Anaerolineae bacterium]
MKALYVTSVHTFSGKTAVCLALARRLQREGRKVGYFKPVSAHPWEPIPGEEYDEDAAFVRRVLGLEESVEDMVGVVLTPALVNETRWGCTMADLMPEIEARYRRVAEGKEIMLIEGGASLREGLSLGVDPIRVANTLDVPVLAIVRFRNPVSMADACIAARRKLGERLVGMLINAVPQNSMELLEHTGRPCMEERAVPILGILPLQEQLMALSVGELAEVLNAQFLTLPEKKELLIEQLVVGAMSVEQMLPRVRRIPGSKAIITGGDRTDIQLVALETATTNCLILTGMLHPIPEVLRRAEDNGVPVLLVHDNTMETVEKIERVYGKTRLGQTAKLERFEVLMEQHFDFKRLYQSIGL